MSTPTFSVLPPPLYHTADKLEIVSATHLRTRYHTADERVYRQRRDSLCYSPPSTISHCRQTRLSLATNAFCARDKCASHWRRTLLALETNTFRAGDKHVLCWRRTHLALETKAFSAADEHVENARLNFIHAHTHTHTHTQLATSYFQTELMPRCLLVTALHTSKNRRYCTAEIQKVSTCTTAFSTALKWPS